MSFSEKRLNKDNCYGRIIVDKFDLSYNMFKIV